MRNILRYIIYYILVKLVYPIKSTIEWLIVSNTIFMTQITYHREDCAICLESIEPDDAMHNANCMVDACIHMRGEFFHAECINKYIMRNIINEKPDDMICICPLCRYQYKILIIK